MKILLLKPSSLGDVVQALPVLRLLKRHLLGSEIYWWVQSTFAPLLEGDPDLAGVLRFERRGWAAPRHWAELWRTIRWMREQAFDWVIDLQSLARSGAVVSRNSLKLSATAFDEITYTSQPASPTGTYQAVAYLVKDHDVVDAAAMA